VLQPHLDDLVREIRRSLNYYQSQQTEGSQNKQIDVLMISGGGAKLPGLVEYIGHKLSIPAITADVFSNPRFLVSTSPEETNGMELAIASGLAMRAHMRAA
jgi:type IV pilus assembly protein PilM